MLHFGPSAKDLAFLASTAAIPWDRIWLRGGRIDERRSPAAGVYEVSQITFGSEAPLWISADAADVRNQPPYYEVFFMGIQRDERCGDPTFEARWRPRRADLTDTPADLDFSAFRIPGRGYALVKQLLPVGTEEGPERVSIDEGLLVTAASGERLLFYCDRLTPLDMFVTMNAAHILDYLARASEVRSVVAEA